MLRAFHGVQQHNQLCVSQLLLLLFPRLENVDFAHSLSMCMISFHLLHHAHPQTKRTNYVPTYAHVYIVTFWSCATCYYIVAVRSFSVRNSRRIRPLISGWSTWRVRASKGGAKVAEEVGERVQLYRNNLIKKAARKRDASEDDLGERRWWWCM